MFNLNWSLKNRNHKTKYQGFIFNKLPLLQKFYGEFLPFDLTNAQKKVIKEIRADVTGGFQMNRLLQGDVGSGENYGCVYLYAHGH